MESKLIGMVAGCNMCKHLITGLENTISIDICDGKLWLKQNFNSVEISSEESNTFLASISNAKNGSISNQI